MIRKILFLLVLLLFTGHTGAAIYKWVDKDGKTHYGECPPPECKAEEIKPAAKPGKEETRQAQERLKRLQEQQKQSQEKRRQSRKVEQFKQEEEQQKRVYRKKRCIHARQNLHVLEKQRPVYYINEQGEREFLDDKVRSDEMNQLREDIENYCQ